MLSVTRRPFLPARGGVLPNVIRPSCDACHSGYLATKSATLSMDAPSAINSFVAASMRSAFIPALSKAFSNLRLVTSSAVSVFAWVSELGGGVGGSSLWDSRVTTLAASSLTFGVMPCITCCLTSVLIVVSSKALYRSGKLAFAVFETRRSVAL